MAIRGMTETETVVKRIVPYLERRHYDVENDLSFEPAAKGGGRYEIGYVDILVHCRRNRPWFLIEAKRALKALTLKDRDQAVEYGCALKVPFVVVTNGTEVRCYNVSTKDAIQWDGELEGKVPTREQLPGVVAYLKANRQASVVGLGEGDATTPFRPGLPLKQLNELFRRCHNVIRKIEKDEEHAFADFSRFLFLKLLEEKADIGEFDLPYSYRFYELSERPVGESDQVKDAVLKMLRTIREKTKYGEVLQDELRLKSPKTFGRIVRELAGVYFRDSSLDSKGAAFEYYVRATLKGKKLGQYFTPRPLVELMSCLVGERKVIDSLRAGTQVKVMDPACGTGGFLVYQMQAGLRFLEEAYRCGKIVRRTRDELAEKLRLSVFYGSDANEGVASAAKMNMIIAGDGHTNIRCEDSLARASCNWSKAVVDCDLILTNPPFGTSEADSLTGDDLAEYKIRTTKGQLLFLQKMVQCTVRGGEICSVIDEGVLNTASAVAVRRWLFEGCKVVAVVRLPADTFAPNKINVRASVLYMRRRDTDDEEMEGEEWVTFCDLKSLGYRGTGESIRGFDFGRLRKEVEESVLARERGARRSGYQWEAFDVEAKEIRSEETCRLDYKYWEPSLKDRLCGVEREEGTKTIKEVNLIETVRGKSPSAAAYVDAKDGYALVVKAGSNISKFGMLVEAGDFVEKHVFDEMTEGHLREGDVLVACTGDGTLGKSCVYRSGLPAVADGHVSVIRVDQKVVYPEYLCDYLRVGFGGKQIERLYTGSTGLIELSPEDLDKVLVVLPGGVGEQRRRSKALRQAECGYQKAIEGAHEALARARENFVLTR